jgi:parallel beta-helix repeat protein
MNLKLITPIIIMLFLPSIVSADTSVTQYGITWSWQEDREVGQFANGDYWVVGPITITSITPEFDGMHNGWEVNPLPSTTQSQGYEYWAGSFDANLVPDLNYYANPGDSIVKAVSLDGITGDCYSGGCLKKMAVLTVVTQAEADLGLEDYFRPPYVSDDKPLYPISDIRTELLPSAPITPAIALEIPTLTEVYDDFKMMQMDYLGARTGRILKPQDNMGMDHHGCSVGRRTGAAILRLMLDDPLGSPFGDPAEEKMPTLIGILQYGIDMNHAILNGQVWASGGGHDNGRKIVLAFASVMLDDQGIKDTLANNQHLFEEDQGIYYGDNAGTTLYGFDSSTGAACSESQYWTRLVGTGGEKSCRDPYGYIDGGWIHEYEGEITASNYAYTVYQSSKAAVPAMVLMPELAEAWDNDLTFDYMDRFTNIGYWTQPDPCAPPEDTMDNYQVTFGPDPNNPGMCILDTNPSDGIGRFPSLHNTGANAEEIVHGVSSFFTAMWDAYRGPSCYDGICEAGETCVYDCGNCDSPDVLCVPDEYATIQAAVNAAQPGDTVSVSEGTYNEKVTTQRNGLSGNRITIMAKEGDTVTMQGFEITHDYITVDGFEITSSDNGINIEGDYAEVLDNFIYDVPRYSITDSGSHNTIRGNRIYRPGIGIVVSGSDSLVENNEIERVYHWDVLGDCDYTRFFGSGHVFRNNYFHDSVPGSDDTCNDAGSCCHIDCFQTFDNNYQSANDITIENNRCYGFSQGIMSEAEILQNSGNIVVRYNVFANGSQSGGNFKQYMTGVIFEHNTVADIHRASGTDINCFGVWVREGSEALSLKDNIFYNICQYGYLIQSGDTDPDYNLFLDAPDPDPVEGIHEITMEGPVETLFTDYNNYDFTPLPGSPACGAASDGSDIGAIPCSGTVTYCGDGSCNGAETCSSCPGDCLTGPGQVCCSGTLYTGNCCSASDCSGGQVCTNHVCTDAEPGDITEGLVLWLPFNGNFDDVSGSGYIVTNYGAEPADDKDGNDESAYYFDGAGNYMSVNWNPSPIEGAEQSFTMAAWIRTSDNVGRHWIFGDDSGYNHFIFGLGAAEPDSGTSYKSINWRDSTGEGRFYWNIGGPLNGDWSHIAATYDAATDEVHIYWNGQLNASNTVAWGITDIDILYIGRGHSRDEDTPEYFKGEIDDIRVYDRALTQGEIQTLYTGQTYHRADINPADGCIDLGEMLTFINKWKASVADVSMTELMTAIGLWKSGEGCNT